MTVRELAKELNLEVVCEVNMDQEVQGCCVCDLLSHVMANGVRQGAWITVQTHVNVVAVASLLELACILVPQHLEIDPLTIEKAKEEGIAILTGGITAYEMAGRMYALGIGC